MSYIRDLIADVEKTHQNMGKLVAVCQIVVKARKMCLIVSPSGCGKSTAMYQIGKNIPNAIMPDKLSVAGLAKMADKLNSFRSVIIVDDITTTQTEYARKTTITTLCALVYSHRVQAIMADQEFTIEDFHGSALVGVQPIILRTLMQLDEWDGSIQDKVLRYYHMYRPVTPYIGLPNIKFNEGIDIEKVDDFEPDTKNRNWKKLIELGYSQWSRARTLEHIKDMLKAIASLEGRRNIVYEDYEILAELLKPMALENIAVIKEQLEGERFLDNMLLALLVEYYTYGGKFTLAQVAQDYKVTLSQCYKIMAGQNRYWQQLGKSPTIYQVSKYLLELLQSYDLNLNHTGKML